jgi:alanine dehydrogenase
MAGATTPSEHAAGHTGAGAMKIGVVKEIKDRENRVALTPQGVEELVKRGHSVMVEASAGIGSGFDDEAYRRTGAMLVSAAVSEDITFVLSNAENIALHVRDTDLLVGAVLRRGGRAPQIVTEAMVQSMQPGSVVVVSIDQGGCIATARPTSHSAPVYTEHGVIHYCVPNMPGAYPRTSTIALTHATLPYVVALLDKGLDALREDNHFARGVNTHRGQICYRPVAEDLGLAQRYEDFSKLTG